ncbi:protein of unknown function [Cupriavidus taiwanensis]|uniref:Uncharacterized protein n=1 Tax=Cupriavidus taiwanensis TaxID=164546 RepID=A0A7Z7NN93_9BURK|nr:hypothetical protein CBM2594_A80206 [Cupriavidus taiwanensis]SPD41132.1 protein of unknown function [Cupriavidus taiwanensis]
MDNRSPTAFTLPFSSHTARSQKFRTIGSECVTKRIDVPESLISFIRVTDFSWKAESPTLNASSTIRTLGSECTATENASRANMPLE